MRRSMAVVALAILGIAAPVSAQNARHTKPNYVGCLVKDDYEHFVSYMVNKDTEAATQMITDGSCIFLKANLEVYIEDTAIFSGLIQIRPRGTRIALWTAIEAVTN